ncbi:FKBP-type peptidyl-prolyl cis-trans isomerase N-terminal domain-containing protein [Yersinia kristensenii]|uniref:FKBP-type peptidyl-prolyl cis-trans isomerase N-terminal domain-containing protein n=1 Tax=Yersinia kristensenii TaxID=28152 RepID=UPI001C60E2CE|nr:FKBP-type peptidyl-prolyl cis-trans isomerase N-terminal domain-containing protein [Yersinia kristensenii]MBW5812508.1 FKBP-type peptidyl-prolyl cis-trans isomerase [Yersinia kristensenii]MBW5829809.1 FKBP-type peptidyl-prolyl cis-trans isomerase [Yersinia kristensenii]
MKRSQLALLGTLLPLLFPIAAIAKNEQPGVPMLLQFAERYQQREPVQKEKVPPKQQKVRPPAPPANKSGQQSAKELALTLGLQKAQRQLLQQQQVIAGLQQQMEQLNKVKQEKAANPEFDFSTVSLMFSKLRQAMAITPNEQHAKTLVTQAQQKNLQTQQTVTQIAKQRAQEQAELAKMNQQVTDADKRYQQISAKLHEKEQNEARLESEVVQLRGRDKLFATSEILKSATARQSYAAGVALGKDINKMEQERSGWGVDVDRQALFSGVTDAFTGQYKLAPKELDKAFSDSENVIATAREKALKSAQKTDNEFVSNFKQKKGVQQSSSGFWYYIDYVGDEDIKGNAVIDIMVKESLTDGTVINDMESNNKVMSQPLNDYPALFQEVLRLLKNHGSITLVVPPSLAYGEQGNLPEIPPNATMVYEVRIADVKEAVVE